MPAGLGPGAATTFREHIEGAWQSKAPQIQLPSLLLSVFQMTLKLQQRSTVLHILFST